MRAFIIASSLAFCVVAAGCAYCWGYPTRCISSDCGVWNDFCSTEGEE